MGQTHHWHVVGIFVQPRGIVFILVVTDPIPLCIAPTLGPSNSLHLATIPRPALKVVASEALAFTYFMAVFETWLVGYLTVLRGASFIIA